MNRIRAPLLVLLAVGGCRLAGSEGSPRISAELAMIAIAEKVLCGALAVVGPDSEPWRIRIGDTFVYVGGDGKETPRDTRDRLRRLEGHDVVAAVRDYEFHFGPVLVVMCCEWRLGLLLESEAARVVATRESLLEREDWSRRARNLESGRWAAFIDSLGAAQDDARRLENYLASADHLEIARDITGWWVRTLGAPMVKWSHEGIRVGSDIYSPGDVRELAKRVLEYCLGLPYCVLSTYHWSEVEEARRMWVLAELAT